MTDYFSFIKFAPVDAPKKTEETQATNPTTQATNFRITQKKTEYKKALTAEAKALAAQRDLLKEARRLANSAAKFPAYKTTEFQTRNNPPATANGGNTLQQMDAPRSGNTGDLKFKEPTPQEIKQQLSKEIDAIEARIDAINQEYGELDANSDLSTTELSEMIDGSAERTEEIQSQGGGKLQELAKLIDGYDNHVPTDRPRLAARFERFQESVEEHVLALEDAGIDIATKPMMLPLPGCDLPLPGLYNGGIQPQPDVGVRPIPPNTYPPGFEALVTKYSSQLNKTDGISPTTVGKAITGTLDANVNKQFSLRQDVQKLTNEVSLLKNIQTNNPSVSTSLRLNEAQSQLTTAESKLKTVQADINAGLTDLKTVRGTASQATGTPSDSSDYLVSGTPAAQRLNNAYDKIYTLENRIQEVTNQLSMASSNTNASDFSFNIPKEILQRDLNNLKMDLGKAKTELAEAKTMFSTSLSNVIPQPSTQSGVLAKPNEFANQILMPNFLASVSQQWANSAMKEMRELGTSSFDLPKVQEAMGKVARGFAANLKNPETLQETIADLALSGGLAQHLQNQGVSDKDAMKVQTLIQAELKLTARSDNKTFADLIIANRPMATTSPVTVNPQPTQNSNLPPWANNIIATNSTATNNVQPSNPTSTTNSNLPPWAANIVASNPAQVTTTNSSTPPWAANIVASN